MSTRDELFIQFGPILIEGLFDFLLDAINELREEQGNPQLTKEDFIESISNHLSELEPYEWMD